ncbi:MAG: NADH-quinone oxidoreductase subunit C [Burkholderiaceae bacterium]
MTALETLQAKLEEVLSEAGPVITEHVGELTVQFKKSNLLSGLQLLRDDSGLAFDTLIDLCGVDYSQHGDGAWDGLRFASVMHFLSTTNNWRVRVRVFCPEDDFPVLPSVTELWPSANWYERESFDLFGIIYEGHPDLRRILTDYGFVGHPFRKDFPISGQMEMRYDPEQKRVVYQPVTIEPREVVPRVIREDGYGVER